MSLICSRCNSPMFCSCADSAIEREESLRVDLQRALKAEAKVVEVANLALEREKFESSHASTVVAIMREALRWCAGSPDFAPEGAAHEAWKKIGVEAIEMADKYILRSTGSASRNDEINQMRGLPALVKDGALDAFSIISHDRDVWKHRAEAHDLEAFRARRQAEEYRVMGKAQERALHEAQCKVAGLLLRIEEQEKKLKKADPRNAPAVEVVDEDGNWSVYVGDIRLGGYGTDEHMARATMRELTRVLTALWTTASPIQPMSWPPVSPTGRTHHLKTWPEPFSAILEGRKPFEIRKNDRDYAVGDTLKLHEYNAARSVSARSGSLIRDVGYTGRSADYIVTYLAPGGSWGLPAELCVMGIQQKDAK